MSDPLAAAYLDAVRRWRGLRSSEVPGAPPISAPLVIDVPPGYEASQVRLMIVGQEALGWGESINPTLPAEDVLNTLRSWYRDFDRGSRYKATPFWQAAMQIFMALNPAATSRVFLWSNLYKMDVGGRRPSPANEAAFDDAHLLRVETEALRPHVVVFFTGPSYDDRLLRCFPGAMLTPVSRALVRVSHPALPPLSFRTYHPKYLRMSRQWATLTQITSACDVAER